MSTQKNILNALRREPKTITELCALLNVTRNSIDIQIKQLESAGLIRPAAIDRQGKVGKPAIKYEAAPGSEDLNSKGYPVFLTALLKVLRSQLDEKTIDYILTETGKEIASQVAIDPQASFEQRLQIAINTANAIGADAHTEAHIDGTMVVNYSCPLASAVRSEACVCQSMATFFAQTTGKEVSAQCLLDDRLTCRYLIKHDSR